MNQLTEYRREFHKYPENGWREFRTSARVAEILTGMGYDVAMGPDVIEPGSVGEPERLSEEQIRQEMERAVRQGADPAFVKRTQGWPGVMAVLDTGREGPVSAMRFEMDCLPYDEPQRPGYRPCDEGYLSCNPQSVHACGHDGHTAIGLGIAAELMKRKGELKGKIKLFFQPAEETFYGAQSIVDKGHLDDVMNFIAVHIALSAENKPLPSHTVACGCRDFLSDRQLDVYLEGKAAHQRSHRRQEKRRGKVEQEHLLQGQPRTDADGGQHGGQGKEAHRGEDGKEAPKHPGEPGGALGGDGLKGGITRLAERPQHAAGTDIVGGDGTVLPGLGIGDRAQMPVLQEIHVRCAVLDVRLGMQQQ